MVKIVINSIPITIASHNYNPTDIHFELGINRLQDIKPENFKGHVLINNALPEWLGHILRVFDSTKLKKLSSITIRTANLEGFEDFIEHQVKHVEAAGGLVVKSSKVLMIYRFGKWDLPKGKIEKGENPAKAAVREVEEECSIEVKLIEKIAETWHTYTQKNKIYIKKTHWFLMKCVNDAQMKPQKEEDIEKVEWKTEFQARSLFDMTYKNIKKILKSYFAKYHIE